MYEFAELFMNDAQTFKETVAMGAILLICIFVCVRAAIFLRNGGRK